ncbi:MAG TPA: bifunctional DNA primase/polymerase, partial [Alphaproteobacteria bacterium]|nr:bifunctional DNA primase/polymerase [Alphaproteobacteria bacterium]
LEIAELPSCPMTHTQSGGLHLWFRYPDEGELRNRRNMLPGIDVRGRGGYVIVAPSIMANGNPYRWARGNETSPMPQAPIELLETIMGTS